MKKYFANCAKCFFYYSYIELCWMFLDLIFIILNSEIDSRECEAMQNDDIYEPIKISGMFESILNSMDIAVYVSDLETNKIIFANKYLQQRLGESDLVGRCCWEALRSENKRCGICSIPYLLKNIGKVRKVQYFDEVAGKDFFICDSIISLYGGKMVHLSYSMDIADFLR